MIRMNRIQKYSAMLYNVILMNYQEAKNQEVFALGLKWINLKHLNTSKDHKCTSLHMHGEMKDIQMDCCDGILKGQ